ncbi:MAG: L-alanine-DL-glutamate epimerase-like enolase superfamily enzyme [Paraglaciecola sp.]|jgi:L-alanine-DL-glutamate epimerase-like enolase superfamily enzyme
MKITNISIYPVRIPFSFSINHHLKNRAMSSSVVVAVYTDDDKTGYGEGAPREYVTGESLSELQNALENAQAYCINRSINTIQDVDDLCQELYAKYKMPSMISALEIAFLDLLGQNQHCSISRFLNNNQSFPINYSGVLPYLSLDKLLQWLMFVKKLELQQIKMKVGYPNDVENLALARKILGWEVDIRVDANRAWTMEQAIVRIKELERFNISCVEEPLIAEEIEKLPQLSRKVTMPLLLDESVYTLNQAAYFAEKINPKQLLFNLKISKSGGLRAASAIHKFAKAQGIACQLGCNVGETAILSSAGRLFAQTHDLKYLEGSFAPFFMEEDIGTKPLTFSKKGIAQRLEGDGLGISIDLQKLKKYSQPMEIAS